MAHATANTGMGVRIQDVLIGLLKSAPGDEGNITLRVHVKGAGRSAGGLLPFIDGRGVGGMQPKDGFLTIGKLYRADLEALLTVRAQVRSDPAGPLIEISPETGLDLP